MHASVERTNLVSAGVPEKAGFSRYADTAELLSYQRR